MGARLTFTLSIWPLSMQMPPTGPMIASQFSLTGQCRLVCSPARLGRLEQPQTRVASFLRLGVLHDCTLTGMDSPAWNAGAATSMEGTAFEEFNRLRAAALSGQGVALCPKAMILSDLKAAGLGQISQTALDKGNNHHLLGANTGTPANLHQAQELRDRVRKERGKTQTDPDIEKSHGSGKCCEGGAPWQQSPPSIGCTWRQKRTRAPKLARYSHTTALRL